MNESAQPQLPPLPSAISDLFTAAVSDRDFLNAYKESYYERGRQLLFALAENESLKAQLGQCYILTGADPDIDADEPWRLAPYAVREVQRLREELDEAEAERDALKAAKPLRMFVWDGRGAYKISVCAPSVAEARTLALDEIAVHGMSEIEGSPMFRAKAHVMQEQPHIYLRPNAELVLSENGETEELNICLESECSKRKTAESRLATMEAERDKLLEVVREYRKGCPHGYTSSLPTKCPTCIKADALLSRGTKET